MIDMLVIIYSAANGGKKNFLLPIFITNVVVVKLHSMYATKYFLQLKKPYAKLCIAC